MSSFNPDRFNIGAYILKPYARSEKHIKEIKEANIDFIVATDSNKNTLDMFEKYGIGAIVNDVFPHWWGGKGENSGKMAEFNPIEIYEKNLDKICKHEAIWGIDIGDEISSLDFEHCRNICKCCKSFLKDKFLYTNLYANYGVTASALPDERKKHWGCSSYDEYIEKYCKRVPLDYISFDNYLYSSKDLPSFLDNLKSVADMADKYNKAMWFIGQVSSSEEDILLNENKLRFQAYSAMAFGAKAIMWACYTGGWWYNHVLDNTGEKTLQYDRIKNVNHEIKAMAKEYIKYHRVFTHLQGLNSSNRPENTITFIHLSKFKCLTHNTSKELIISEMSGSNNTEALFILAAGDYMGEKPYSIKISLCAKAKKITVFCAGNEYEAEYDSEKDLYIIELKSNSAALITA